MPIPFEILQLTHEQIGSMEAELIALLQDVLNNGASVNFIAPLDAATAQGFWAKVRRETASDERIVLVATNMNHIVGCVHLAFAMQPNGAHRAEVQKLLVHSAYQKQGIATSLMSAIEDAARTSGRTLLVLDTERGSNAEYLYEKVGYSRAGVIPRFARSAGGDLIDTVLFYKELNPG